MKKLLFSVLAISLCAAGVWYLSSCAKQQGPLSPDTSLVGLKNSVADKLPHLAGNNLGGPLATNQSAYAEFDTSLDPATVTTSTVRVYRMLTSSTEESISISVSYDKAIKRITIASSSGSWDNDSRFRVELTTGIKSVSGKQIDGNGNNRAESSAFDNYHRAFYTGVPSLVSYDFDPINMSALTLEAGGGYIGDLVSDITLGNVPAAYTYVTITAFFTKPYDMDTVYEDGDTLHNNFQFYDETDRGSVSPREVHAETNGNTMWAVFELEGKHLYRLTAKGGLTGIRSSQDLSDERPLLGGRYSGGEDGVAEQNDEAVRYFKTADADGNTVTYPVVTLASYPASDPTNPASRCWTVVFNMAMKASSLNTSNIKLRTYDYISYRYNHVVPRKLLYDPITYTLYVYLPNEFYPFSTEESYTTIQVIVLRNVQSVEGYTLDTSGDDIGGMEDDDYFSSWETVYSKLPVGP